MSTTTYRPVRVYGISTPFAHTFDNATDDNGRHPADARPYTTTARAVQIDWKGTPRWMIVTEEAANRLGESWERAVESAR